MFSHSITLTVELANATACDLKLNIVSLLKLLFTFCIPQIYHNNQEQVLGTCTMIVIY